MTAAASLLHVYVWGPHENGAEMTPMFAEATLKRLENVVQMCILPSWVLAWRFMGKFHDLSTALLANALGWCAWTVILSSLVRLVRTVCDGADTRISTRPGVERAAGIVLNAGLPVDLGRRRFLVGAALGAGAGGAGTAFGRATLVTPWDLKVARYEVALDGLPPAMNGFRIVQLTDTHLGPRIPREHVERACEMAAALGPDLIALTGDYIHMGTRYICPAAEIFGRMVSARGSRLGVVATLGNHDFYGDAGLTVRLLKEAGVVVIENDRVFVRAGSGALDTEPGGDGEDLCIAGVSDLLEGVIDAQAALRGVDPSTPRVMLAHNPDTSEWITRNSREKPRVDLMLSGHTHGGQVVLPLIGPPVVPSAYGYAHGMVRSSLCPLIVSAGVGMSIMPLRVNVPPEVVEIVLTRRAR